MSNKNRPSQYADPRSVVLDSRKPNTGLLANGGAAPTDGQSGYAKGCLWVNDAGSVGTLLYINNGSATSSTWVNIF